VFLRQPDSANPNFSRHTNRYGTALRIHDVDTSVLNRAANRRSFCSVCAFSICCPDRSLSRTIQIEEATAGRPPLNNCSGTGFPGNSNNRKVGKRLVWHCCQGGWRQCDSCHALSSQVSDEVRPGQEIRFWNMERPPRAEAIAISKIEASKLSEANCSTRLPGPVPSTRCCAATTLQMPRWVTSTPFGWPVDPEV